MSGKYRLTGMMIFCIFFSRGRRDGHELGFRGLELAPAQGKEAGMKFLGKLEQFEAIYTLPVQIQ